MDDSGGDAGSSFTRSWRALSPRAIAWSVGIAVYVVAVAVRLLFAKTPPYGDENLHFVTALRFTPVVPGYTDVWENPWNAAGPLVWQRPFYYAAMHFPAMAGFTAFRVANILVAAALAPLAVALLRSWEARWWTAAAAGLLVALTPPLVFWGAIAFMDSAMTALLAGAILCFRNERWFAGGLLAVAAVWTKETAFVAVVASAAFVVARGMVRGTDGLWPIRFGLPSSALLWAVALAPLPLLWASTHGLPVPGGEGSGDIESAVDEAFRTPWLIVVLVLGLSVRRSRFLSLCGLGAGAFFVALVATGRSVEAWYLVPSIFFAVVGGCMAVDALLGKALDALQEKEPPANQRRASRSPRRLPWPSLVGALAASMVLVLATFPTGAAAEWVHPINDRRATTIEEDLHYATKVRDHDWVEVVDDLPFEDGIRVLLIETGWPPPYVFMVPAQHVYLDSASFRSAFPTLVDPLAQRIENATTWTLLKRGELPMQRAIEEVYADCIVGRHGDLIVLQGTACSGRGPALLEAEQRNGGPKPPWPPEYGGP